MGAVLNFRAAADSGPAFISLHGEIGAAGATAAVFEKQLRALGSNSHAIELHINSPGGDLFQANAIFAMLDRHPARIVVYVDGLAASGASLIAMAGDEIIMPANAMMMIHNPNGGVVGTAKDVRDMAETLDQLAEGMVATYAKRTGLDISRVKAMLDAETWLTAAEAVALGFATRVEAPVAVAAIVPAGKYRHTPPQLVRANGVDDLVQAYAPGQHVLQRGRAKTVAEMAAGFWAKRDAKGTGK